MSVDFEKIPLIIFELFDELMPYDFRSVNRPIVEENWKRAREGKPLLPLIKCSDRGYATVCAWGWDPPLLEPASDTITMHGLAAYVWHKEQKSQEAKPGEPISKPKRPAKKQTPEEPPPPRLTVSLSHETITLDGKTHEVKSTQALRWVQVLAARAGEWISSQKAQEHNDELIGCRTDRLIKYLPKEVSTLIESRPGKGSRWLA